MWKSFITGVCSLALAFQASAQQPARPKLVVGLMVDQMRWDYLYRFADRYGNDGFKRLLNDGFSCENTIINYIPTYTAIGHSSVYTGSVPSIHGVAANDWIIQSTGEAMYCTQDDNVQGVGTTEKEGKQSPRNLLTSTITDQLKLATNFQSKVIGISIKDRGGILPAGHFADAAYWFESKSGDWISSTFYMKDLPNWVKGFNKQKLAEKYLKQDWNTLYPIETYTNSIADNNPYEGKWPGEASPTFPRKTSELMKDAGYELIKTTPQGNTLTLDFAKSAIQNEKLGHNPTNSTDFLCVSLSATDYVGHRYSLSAVEIEDTYLRLDRDIANFITYLDETVGKGNYTFFLTADHAASYNPMYYTDQKGNGGYLFTRQIQRDLNNDLAKKFGSDKIVRSLMNYQVHLNYQLIDSLQLDLDKVKQSIITKLNKEEGIAYVVDMEGNQNMFIPAPIREKIINGYNRKNSGAIQIIPEPQWYSGTPRGTGTTHGVWSAYDSHIPLIFMGWGVKKGVSNKEVHIVDIAPTIASLLHVMEPNGSIGKPIVEVLGQ
ncbi:alkaline phosphatase PafA [Sphingobacterium psychroaquaticum]|uniref:Predicted pyrophosphatase or phosphodiesterase, AlkP superfamily n=1 Tax=Sphingobacterium psychroaquaticum TaxID=561061 RepID=A0A1X7KGM2_9SPHI|nr:alkaline phosphatase PafA [Sphingobacterium psychroaquaticum]QBQ42826.1 alkaline phosphatase family protein [Sphingobacterium psychroaquaticum]SMG40113.1 Predicted pyrophosphatase or phosphodiesterase, AlkP superfamily [Sphingobacterium psychroaquaticum]